MNRATRGGGCRRSLPCGVARPGEGLRRRGEGGAGRPSGDRAELGCLRRRGRGICWQRLGVLALALDARHLVPLPCYFLRGRTLRRAEGTRVALEGDLLSNFRDLAFTFRGHCGQLNGWLKQPVPFPYFHSLSLVMIFSFLLISVLARFSPTSFSSRPFSSTLCTRRSTRAHISHGCQRTIGRACG